LKYQRLAYFGGPLAAVAILTLVELPGQSHAVPMLALAIWMAIWWVSECVPLALTAMIPLVFFPLLGIATGKEVAPKYFNSIIFLFVGGFLIAQAMERTGLHRRIALNMLARLHASPLQLALGFSVTTAFLSMWISNTATCMLMVTIAIPLLARLSEEHGEASIAPLAASFLLIIAYSANIGGMGTPVGTAPNLVLLENMRVYAPELAPSFLQWMMLGVPVVVVGLAALFLLLGPRLARLPWKETNTESLKSALAELGPVRREEFYVAGALSLTATLWMTRTGIDIEGFAIPGWSSLLPYAGIDDGTVAIFGAGLLFLAPNREGAPILGRDAFARLPWDIIILLGGGFALAYGMQNSGLSGWLGGHIDFLGGIPLPLLMLGIALLMTFLTGFTSNTASTQLFLPILAAAAVASDNDMLMMLLPAALAASCAFMLPVATPPNAIVYATGKVPLQMMLRTGLRMNLILAAVIVMLVWLMRPVMPT
jgi:sodium-dependent dicarboxylate transporter 2/3/5